MKKEELKSLIMEKTNGKLTETDVDKMVESLSEEQLEYLRVEVTSDPYIFESETREKKDIFEHSWAGEDRYITETEVLMGDYEPGIDDEYLYSQNGDYRTPEEYHKMSDFSISRPQVASVYNEHIDNYNGNDIEEYDDILYIYIPEEKEYGENVSFKQIVLNSRRDKLFNAIKEKVGDRLDDEQINLIISQFNLEDSSLPKIGVTSNPYEFEKETRMDSYVFEHSWAGSEKNIVETNVLIGDYQPGIDEIYEYSQNGDSRTPEESHEMSDFSINQTQIAIAYKEYIDHYNGNDLEEYSDEIHIYIPEEKEYGENVSFKQIVLNKRREQLFNAIKEKVGDRLSDEQITLIISQFNLEDSSLPKIGVTSNPYEFEKKTRRNSNVFEHSWAGSKKNIVETNVLIGDYQPGIDDIYEYSQNGDSRTPEESHEMSDFILNNVQAATVFSNYDDQYNGAHRTEHEESIQIYLPDEKLLETEFKGTTSFGQLRALIMKKAEEASLEGIKGEMESIKTINNDKTVEQNQQIEQ